MCEKYRIDDKTRFLVLHFDAHMQGEEISKIINRPLRTIRLWESRTKKGEDIRTQKRANGRRRLINEETENKIIQLVNENPESASTTKIAARVGISSSSIAHVLAKKGYRYLKYLTFNSPVIYSEEQRMLRVDFCKKMLSDEGRLIYRTFFSDEMGIQLNKSLKTRAWQIPTKQIRKKMSTENIKLNCWGAISAQGATSLNIYDKSMNGEFYRQVLIDHKAEMEKLFPDGEFYFLQDNLPAHRVNEDWIIKQQLKLIKMPKRSPDLNIIENIWAALKERVASDAPTNEKEMRASLLRNWEIITKPERLQPFLEMLQRRYVECIAKEGQKLSY